MSKAGKKRIKSLAEQLEELDAPSKDFDPEALSNHGEESDSESDEGSNGSAGRGHYEEVGKSKLRKQEAATLGPQYKGARVSRDVAFDEDSDDPFSREFGNEDESESDAEKGAPFGINGKLAESEEEDEMEEDEEEENEDEDDGEDLDSSAISMSDDGQDDEFGSEDEQSGPDRSELRKIMAEEQQQVAANLSQAAKADAEKGDAVKKQRAMFDALLNTRIRLQKALQSSNSMADIDLEPKDTLNGSVLAAEAAAIKLWNSLNSLRDMLQTSRRGTKRKHDEFKETTSSDILWTQMRLLERENIQQRQQILEKWSDKAKNTVVLPTTRRLNATVQSTIIDVLNTHLSDMDRLTKRTHVPRSCAPSQVAKGLVESQEIYDDADFYGPLLKDLLEQRSQENIGALNGLSFQSVAPWQAAREAKTRKVVDTRASKGRKMRFTVQEKIQNFMAPEDRGKWGDRQREELFASLFGRRATLEENVELENEDEDNMSPDGFVMFGS